MEGLRIYVAVEDLKDFESYVKRKAIVVFGAPDWCVPCQRLHPHVVKLADKLDIPVIDVDVDKAQAIKDTYDIMSVPRVYEFVDGKPVRELKGRTVIALEKELAA